MQEAQSGGTEATTQCEHLQSFSQGFVHLTSPDLRVVSKSLKCEERNRIWVSFKTIHHIELRQPFSFASKLSCLQEDERKEQPGSGEMCVTPGRAVAHGVRPAYGDKLRGSVHPGQGFLQTCSWRSRSSTRSR